MAKTKVTGIANGLWSSLVSRLQPTRNLAKATSISFVGIVTLGWILTAIVAVVLWHFYRLREVTTILLFLTSLLTTLYLVTFLITRAEDGILTPNGEPDLPRRYDYWKARTIAWGLFDVTLVSTFFLGVVMLVGNPYEIVPPAYVPFVEISVLVVTVAILSQLTYFSSRSFALDLKGLARETRASSEKMTLGFSEETTKLSQTFRDETRWLLKEVSEQGTKQAEILSRISVSLDKLSDALDKYLTTTEATKKLVEEARQEQVRGEERIKDELRRVDEGRREVERADIARFRPRVYFRLRTPGVVWHHLHVDIYNGGMIVTDVRLSVLANDHLLLSDQPLGNIETQGWRDTDVCDVGNVPDNSRIAIIASLKDGRGRPYKCNGTFTYWQSRGFWGVRANQIDIRPSEYTEATANQIPG